MKLSKDFSFFAFSSCVLIRHAKASRGGFFRAWLKSFIQRRPPPQPPLPTSKKTQKTHVSRGASDCSVLANVMSQDDKDWITYNHNKKRAEVAKGETYGQPGASNMNALVII